MTKQIHRRRGTQLAGLVVFAALTLPPPCYSDPPTDAEVRQMMIQASIAAYPGACPCPYVRAKDGSRCGKRSAWSQPGGASPLCFPSDISDEMVKAFRDKNGV